MTTHVRKFVFIGTILAAVPALAGLPNVITHRGVIAVHGLPFNGAGDFRFALVDRASGAYLWKSDGSDLAGPAQPALPVRLTVANGVYHVRLGDEALYDDGNPATPPVMTAIPRAVFNEHDEVALRIWFDDGANGLHQLTPDQVLTSSPYAQRLPNVFVEESTGNVGIGTTVPSNTLSVVGNADFSSNVGIGTANPTERLDVAGVVKADQFDAPNLPPIGVVLPWFGNPSNLPANWVLCDGRTINDPDSPLNGQAVPNMAGRVPRGLATGQTVGQLGGKDSDDWNVPNHAHAYSFSVGDHPHTLQSAGSHQHESPILQDERSTSPGGDWSYVPYTAPFGIGSDYAAVPKAFGFHTGSTCTSLCDGNWQLTSEAGSHEHTVNADGGFSVSSSTGSAGAASGTISTVPSYVALYHIIRIK